jgi:SAM-dependent methyltransferase
MPYSQGIAPYYDLFDEDPVPGDPAACFLAQFVSRGQSVLDIGAGTGTTAIALASLGIDVTALEPDPEMYAALLVRVANRADVCSQVTPIPKGSGYPTGRKHDLVAVNSVLHLLSDTEQEELVAYAASEAAAGGMIVLEFPVVSPLRLERKLTLRANRELGRTRYSHCSATQAVADGSWRTHWRFSASHDGKIVSEVNQTFEWRPLTHERTAALLQRSGLMVHGDFSGYEGEPYEPHVSRVRLVVVRRAAL